MPRTDNPVLPDEKLIAPIKKAIAQIGVQRVRERVLTDYHARLAEIEQVALNLSPDELATKRFRKLSKEQLLILATTFVANLIELNKQGSDTEEKIKELCLEETALLEKGYPPETIAKNHHPLYINLVKGAIEQGNLSLTPQNSYSFEIYNQAGELETIHNHYAQLYLKYEREFYRQVKRQSNERNNIKQDTPKPVRLYPYLDKISFLLQSDRYSELAAGITAAIGRRFSEVIERGTFVIPDNPKSVYELVFSGQLKKSTDASAYSTYALVPAAVVVAAIARLRTMPKIASLMGTSIQKINTLLPTVNYQIKRHFQETGIAEVLEGEAAVTVHNLRGIYGEIAAHFFCPSRAQFPRFLSQQLGHLIGEETIDNNLSHSTEHYFHYYLIDENGQAIEQMGIKLNEALPSKGFVELAAEFLTSDDWACKLTGVIALTGKSPDDLLKHFVYKRVEGEHLILYTHQVHSQLQPYYQIVTLVDAAKVYDAIAQLKNHPELKPYLDTHTGKQCLAYFRERIADYLGQLGVETYQLAIQQYIALVGQLGLSQPDSTSLIKDNVDNKPASIKTVAWVKKEFEQMRSLLGTSSQNETLIEIINLAKLSLSHQQNLASFSSSVAIDKDVTSNTEVSDNAPLLENDNQTTSTLIPPSQQEEALTSVEEEVTDPVCDTIDDNNTTLSQESLTFSAIPNPSPDLNNDLTSAITTLVNSMAVLTSKFDRFLDTTTTAVTSNHLPNSPSFKNEPTSTDDGQPTQRRPRRKSSLAVERINDAINALIDYNQRVKCEQRWYISAPVLKSLAGGAQVSINEVMKNQKHKIDSHHQSLSLGTQHNRSFHQGHKVTDFISLDF